MTGREGVGTPVCVVVSCALCDAAGRREEDLAATWMGVGNLLTAATADGLGTYVRTGGILEEPALRELVGAGDGVRVLAVVSVGWPAAEEAPRRRTPAAEKTVWLE